MEFYQLQEPFIDAAIRFANIKLNHPNAVTEAFGDMWPMELLPRLRVCRDAQHQTREWLATLKSGEGFEGAIAAMLGRRIDKKTKTLERIDSGIHFDVVPGYRIVKRGKKVHREMPMSYRVSEATLLSICGFAVASIHQAGLHKRVGLCARDGCNNFFIDRVSRGERRRHCHGDECERARNAARQDTWRRRHAKQRSRKA
ncbi:MAG: CGNR zinc finger domain-containing protein [Proteobacteria bacterium]|nr:CGNR zinc finger domain-containing protein [Pseudomonadota bacterium]